MNEYRLNQMLQQLDKIRARYPDLVAWINHTDEDTRQQYYEMRARLERRLPGIRVEYRGGRHVLVPTEK